MSGVFGFLMAAGLSGCLMLMSGCESRKPLELSGIVEVRSVHLAFEEDGYLDTIEVNVNDAVEKASVIATLESRGLVLEYEGAQFELKKAQADLDNLLHTPRAEELAAAKARERSARAVFEHAEEEFERSRKLYEKQVATEQAYRERLMQYQTAKAAYESAGAEAGLVATGSKKETVVAQKMQVGVLERKVAALKVRLEKRQLVSPLEGVTLTRNFEPKEFVRRGQSVVSIADLDDCWVKIYLPEEAFADVEIGQRVEVRLDSKKQPVLDGHVSEISQEAAFAPRMNLRKEQRSDLYFPAKIAVENREHRLKPGMIADVLFRY